jgi:hypothetical protein
MRARSGRRRTSTVSALLAGLLVSTLAGCGGGDEPDPSGGATTSESSTEQPSPSPSASLPESTPTPEPATGPTLDVNEIRVNAPEKWKQTYDTIFVDTAQGRRGGVMLSVVATDGEQLSLRAAERFFWEGERPEGYESQDTLVMGGVTASYYTARSGKHSTEHVVSMWDVGYVVQVGLTVDKGMAAESQRELLDSVVASYQSPRTA